MFCFFNTNSELAIKQKKMKAFIYLLNYLFDIKITIFE